MAASAVAVVEEADGDAVYANDGKKIMKKLPLQISISTLSFPIIVHRDLCHLFHVPCLSLQALPSWPRSSSVAVLCPAADCPN